MDGQRYFSVMRLGFPCSQAKTVKLKLVALAYINLFKFIQVDSAPPHVTLLMKTACLNMNIS